MNDRDVLDEQFRDDDEDTLADRYLTFVSGGTEYAVAVANVVEIVVVGKIADIPEVPSFVKGVVNLRGAVVPVIDMRLRVGREERSYDDRTCIVVLELEETRVGLVVDRVREFLLIPEADISPPPKIRRGPEAVFTGGLARVGENVLPVIDVDRLLYEEDPAGVAAAADAAPDAAEGE